MNTELDDAIARAAAALRDAEVLIVGAGPPRAGNVLKPSRLSGVKRSASQVRAPGKRRPQVNRASAAAAKSAAAERERIRRMSPHDRALLALDLGERFSAFAKPRP